MGKQKSTKVDEKKPIKVRKFVNPFHCLIPVVEKGEEHNYDRHVSVSDMKIDKDTFIALPKFSVSSFQEEISSQRDNCGMELYKKQLRQGLAKPEDFYDDGMHGLDTGIIPETVHDAKKASEKLNKELADVASAIGISDKEELSVDLFIERLTNSIKETWKSQQAKQSESTVLQQEVK